MVRKLWGGKHWQHQTSDSNGNSALVKTTQLSKFPTFLKIAASQRWTSGAHYFSSQICSSSSILKSRFYLPGTMFLKRSPSFPAPRPWTQVGPSPYVKGFYCFVPWLWIASLLPSYGKQLLLPHRTVWVDIQPLLDQSEIFPRIYQIGSKENVAEPLEARRCELGTNGSHASNLLGKAPLKD